MLATVRWTEIDGVWSFMVILTPFVINSRQASFECISFGAFPPVQDSGIRSRLYFVSASLVSDLDFISVVVKEGTHVQRHDRLALLSQASWNPYRCCERYKDTYTGVKKNVGARAEARDGEEVKLL